MDTLVAEQTGQKKYFSGSTLKLIAVITMLIDHVAAAVLARIILLGETDTTLYYTYYVMRQIGRLAFPIYIFLMIEGFEKTSSKKKYLFRMAIFALISEIPFDLAFCARLLEFSYQNIFFTLLIGMLTMLLLDAIEKKQFPIAVRYLLSGIVIVLGMGLAEVLRTDYGMKGVICIVVMYLFRRDRISQIIAGSVAFLWEITAPLAFIPIAFYNGKRGMNLKYVFYVFYPLHLLIIYLICVALGIQAQPVV